MDFNVELECPDIALKLRIVHYFLFERRRSHGLIHVGNDTQDYAVLILRVQY